MPVAMPISSSLVLRLALGENTFALDKGDWGGALNADNLRLPAVNVDTRGGWVWINKHPGSEPLRGYLNMPEVQKGIKSPGVSWGRGQIRYRRYPAFISTATTPNTWARGRRRNWNNEHKS